MPLNVSKSFPLIAAIDLGSNSFHMVLAKTHGREIRILDRIGEKVQLAAGLNEKLILDEAAMERGLDCLRRFAQLITDLPRGAVRIVSTSTLRTAHNRQEFISRAKEILDHDIDVISGREEARLIFLGICHTSPDTNEKRLAIDIGGGSTELIIGQGFEPQYLSSLQMGCVSFSRRFFKNGKISASRYSQAYTAARLELLEVEKPLKRMGWSQVMGASGTLRSIAQACFAAGFGEGEINAEGIACLKKELLKLKHHNQINFPGVKPERCSIFPAGLAIVEAIFDALQLEQVQPSDGALREGVLFDLLGRHQQEDVRSRSITALMQRSHVDIEQAERVESKALEVLQQLATDWQLNEEWHEEMLSWAARVHEVGLDIAHYHFHKHGAYLIEHSDLAGFSRQEQQHMALLVRGHRRNIPLELFKEAGSKGPDLLLLCVILRLAILLHRIRGNQPAPELRLKAHSKDTLQALFPACWLNENPLTAADFTKEAQWLQRINFTLSLGEYPC